MICTSTATRFFFRKIFGRKNGPVGACDCSAETHRLQCGNGAKTDHMGYPIRPRNGTFLPMKRCISVVGRLPMGGGMVGAYGQKEIRRNGAETGRMIGGKGDFENGGENRWFLARAQPLKKLRNLIYRGNRGGGILYPHHTPPARGRKIGQTGPFSPLIQAENGDFGWFLPLIREIIPLETGSFGWISPLIHP